MIDPRLALEQLIKENRDDYSTLSRLIGRNPTYIQQFIKRGSPKRLDERDRITLARYFGISDSLLGGPSQSKGATDQLVEVPVLEVFASEKNGTPAGTKRPLIKTRYSKEWLQQLTDNSPPNLAIVRVAGDSMEPTLRFADEAIVDLEEGEDKLRDGIYVMRLDDVLHIKRVSVDPSGSEISIVSDNPLYRSWENISRNSVAIVGRVIWIGRPFP